MPVLKNTAGEIIQQSLPQGWLQEQAEEIFNNAFTCLKGFLSYTSKIIIAIMSFPGFIYSVLS